MAQISNVTSVMEVRESVSVPLAFSGHGDQVGKDLRSDFDISLVTCRQYRPLADQRSIWTVSGRIQWGYV